MVPDGFEAEINSSVVEIDSKIWILLENNYCINLFFKTFILVISNTKTTTQIIDTSLGTINTTSSLNFTTFENTTSTISIDQTTPFNSTEYFNSTQNYTSEFTKITTSTELPATIVSLNNLVILSALNENKTSRAIINPDEKFSAVKSEVIISKINLHYWVI